MEDIESRFKNTARSKTFKNIIRTFGLDEKAVLDIGCSFGEFLVSFGSRSMGITIAKEEVEYGKKRGLNILEGNIESDDLTIPEKAFDVIWANNIFEHLYSPHAFLQKIKKYLKPNGFLILGVPCIPKITSLTRLNKFRGSLAVAHINFFTRDTLIKTVERGGWKVKTTRSFHFQSKPLDTLLHFIAPHFYIVAVPDKGFRYHEKRMKELAGYGAVSR